MVTIAHREEVEVGADGPASEPPSGPAAAAPPAGADGTSWLQHFGGNLFVSAKKAEALKKWPVPKT
jgi:hypothetical protein